MQEHLFVIFPPGLGGNHCTNLLALTDRFNKSVDYSMYDSSATNAHFGAVTNLQLEYVTRHLHSLLNSNSVLCGHVAEFIWLKESGIVDRFINRKFLIVTLPKNRNSIAYKRLVNLHPQYANEYFYQEQCLLYRQDVLEKLFDEHDFFTLDSEKLFSEDGSELFAFIESEFYTKLDIKTATEIHSKWISKIMVNLV